jgi:hypothetical protein
VQKNPARHTLQSTLPSSSWYWPPEHGVQVVAPSAGWCKPFEHGLQAVALELSVYVPATQTWL